MLVKYIPHRAIIYTLTLLITIITVLFAFPRGSDVPGYATAPVRKGNIESSVLAIGRIDAIERVNVEAQVSGQLKSLKVKQGDRVIKGQLIAEADGLPQCSDLRDVEVALNEVKTGLRPRQALLGQAELRFKRQLRMLRGNASPHEDLEFAETMPATTRVELHPLNVRLVQAQTGVDKRKFALEYTRVVTLMDGIIITTITRQGQTVSSNQSASTIIKLAHLGVMIIKTQIFEADIARISVGQKTHFSVFSEPDKRYSATLRAAKLAPESIMRDDSLVSNASASGSEASNASIYCNALLDVSNPEN